VITHIDMAGRGIAELLAGTGLRVRIARFDDVDFEVLAVETDHHGRRFAHTERDRWTVLAETSDGRILGRPTGIGVERPLALLAVAVVDSLASRDGDADTGPRWDEAALSGAARDELERMREFIAGATRLLPEHHYAHGELVALAHRAALRMPEISGDGHPPLVGS